MASNFGLGATPEPGSDEFCSLELGKLWDAYNALASGKQTVRIRARDNREIQYSQGDIDKVVKLYSYWWDQCGAGSGLPDLRVIEGQSLRERGGPVTIC